jgi:hypothetical protein
MAEMNQRAVPDTQIAAEIDQLRARCENTRELYREVCALLFFRYGITPTANRLYQYVRKGSMGTPAEVLANFWRDLRERTRVRIDRPDLPEELREAAGDLVHSLWARAQDQAERSFGSRRAQTDAQVDSIRSELVAAREELDAERRAHAGTRIRLEESAARAVALARELATNQGRQASMTEMLRESGDEMKELRVELAAAQRDVARAVGEANALRVQLALAKRRRAGKPIAGVPPDPDLGQENLGLDRGPEDAL